MNALLADLAAVLLQTLRDVAPIAAVLIGFQALVIRRRLPDLRRLLVGFACVIAGLTLFLVGLGEALFPLCRAMATQLTDPAFLGISDSSESAHWFAYRWVYLFALCIGIAAVMVEPAVIAVAIKANDISRGAVSATGLRIAIAIGVGVGIAIGTLRIVTGGDLQLYILAAYVVVIAQTVFAPRWMIPLAYDSGGVSTSTVTVPLVAALGLGLASSVPGRSPIIDGFGLIAFAVVFPIISVLAYAQLAFLWERRPSGDAGP